MLHLPIGVQPLHICIRRKWHVAAVQLQLWLKLASSMCIHVRRVSPRQHAYESLCSSSDKESRCLGLHVYLLPLATSFWLTLTGCYELPVSLHLTSRTAVCDPLAQHEVREEWRPRSRCTARHRHHLQSHLHSVRWGLM
jgi:hypothetical protein